MSYTALPIISPPTGCERAINYLKIRIGALANAANDMRVKMDVLNETLWELESYRDAEAKAKRDAEAKVVSP